VNPDQVARAWWTAPDHRGLGLTYPIANSLRERYPNLSSPRSMPAWVHVSNYAHGFPPSDPSSPTVNLSEAEGDSYAAQINGAIRSLLAQR
jgi:hypothetical protein